MNVPADTDQLVQRTNRALADGTLTASDLERLLERAPRRRRIDLGGVLRALGVITAVAGLALVYVIHYHGLSLEARRLTPFAFPAVLLLAAPLLSIVRRPRWEVELAAVVGEVTLAVALIAAGPAWPSYRDYGEVGSAVSLVIALVLYRALRLARLSTWAATASLVALMQFAWSDVSAHSVAQTFLVEGVVAAFAGVCLLRLSRPVARQALYLATLLGLAGGLVGVVADTVFDPPTLSVWTLALFVTTLLALAVAVLLEMNGLLWLGTLGTLMTLAAVADATRRDQHWAYLVVAVGIGLAVVGASLHRLRRPPQPVGVVETAPPNG